jgi:hypothetical protein
VKDDPGASLLTPAIEMTPSLVITGLVPVMTIRKALRFTESRWPEQVRP